MFMRVLNLKPVHFKVHLRLAKIFRLRRVFGAKETQTLFFEPRGNLDGEL